MTKNLSKTLATMLLTAMAPAAMFAQGSYPVNFSESTTPTHESRHTEAIRLTSSDGAQTIEVNQTEENLMYIKRLDNSFTAKAGDKVTPAFSATMGWMCGYAYIDYGNDGMFDVDYTTSEITNAKDLVTYSYYLGKNSEGKSISGEPSYNPPAFTIPATTPAGIYRMRYKIDWDNVDPGGNISKGNSIVKNGGVIVDTRLIVHGDNVNMKLMSTTNGTIKLADGTTLTNKQVPFGKDLTINIVPNECYALASLTLKHGFNLNGNEIVNGMRQWTESSIRSFSIKNNQYTIPAKYIDGDVEITATFKKKDVGSEGNGYKLNFDKGLMQLEGLNALTKITFAGSTTESLNVPNGTTVYRDLLPQEIGVMPGDVITPSVEFNGNDELGAYLYIDYDQNGGLNPELASDGSVTENSELVSFSNHSGKNSEGKAGSGVAMPSFTVPADLPAGMYRARLKLDRDNIDPAGDYSMADVLHINHYGGYIVDFLLNVHEASGKLEVNSLGGHIVGGGYGSVPLTVKYGKAFDLHALAPADGYKVESITVRHGHNLNGPQYINGNRQWASYNVNDIENDDIFTIKANNVNGDVRVDATFKGDGTEKYKLVFSDEFNQPDGTYPEDNPAWTKCTRESPTWKRFVANTEEAHHTVAYIEDGKFVARCKPTPAEFADVEKTEMISAAIEGKDLNYFTYGIVEARFRTTPHIGNFPAFWMMPNVGVDENGNGWPWRGEIDIWEQIDEDPRAYCTIHTHCTYDLGMGKPSTANKWYKPAEYSVMTLDWQPELLTWYLNGEKVFSYAKSTDQNLLDKGQWQFDHDFYIILNQSVGNGAWAKPADTSFDYATYFDYVRVYQTDEMNGKFTTNAINKAFTDNNKRNSIDVYTRNGGVLLVTPTEQSVSIHDIAGRRVFNAKIQGNHFVELPKGLYIAAGKKVVVD